MTTVVEPHALLLAGLDDNLPPETAKAVAEAADRFYQKNLPVIGRPGYVERERIIKKFPPQLRKQYSATLDWIQFPKYSFDALQDGISKNPQLNKRAEINVKIGGMSFSFVRKWDNPHVSPSSNPELYLVFDQCVPNECREANALSAYYYSRRKVNFIVDPSIVEEKKDIHQGSLYFYVGRISEEDVFLRMPDTRFSF